MVKPVIVTITALIVVEYLLRRLGSFTEMSQEVPDG
jgi:hypothetical protein